MRPTKEQIDELELTLITFHSKNHDARPVQDCQDLTCREACNSIAWLRTQLRHRRAA